MTLRLILRSSPSIPLEVEGIIPHEIRGKSLGELERLPVFQGNHQAPLAEFFSLSGDGGDGEMVWEGDLSRVHWIGAGMTGGRIVVEGNAGRHLGSEMQGGEIEVLGDAGDWAGAELHEGLIRVRGNAGNLVGAAYQGGAKGMTGGTILIHGNAGNEIGRCMRRGLVAVGGAAGDLVGFNMLAGTILIFGASGQRHGAGMKRGTIGLLGPRPAALLPTFRHACRCRPDFMPLLLGELQERDFPVPADILTSYYELYSGDLLEGGRGEILMRAP